MRKMLQPIINLWHWHPPVGVWIGVLAVLAVLVPLFREKIGRKERAAWTGLMLILLLLEFKSIYQDRNEHQAEFETTLTGMEKLMSEATGGDSYIYFEVAEPTGPTEIVVPGIAKGYIFALALPHFVGEFPLHDVVVSPFCPSGWLPSVDYGTFFPNEIGRPRQFIYLQFPPTISERDLNCGLFISTSNGSYSQNVHFLRKDDRWTWGSILGKYGQKEFRDEFFGAGFPKDYKW
jgi:hypothetical protein